MTGRQLAEGTSRAPAEIYDVGLSDLDGVIYRGERGIPHAAESVAAAREAGMRFGFVTNNALRTPDEVAALLIATGVQADSAEVVTSAQAGAAVLAERLPAGARVLACGGAGLVAAIRAAGLVPVEEAGEGDQAAVGVANGFDPTLTYARLAQAALAIRSGAFWVATNTDATVPTEAGLLPGNGALVAMLRTATDCEPVVAGKPERALHEESIRRTGAERPLVLGDRLDTDIEAAVRFGAASLLVFTGVCRPADVVLASAPYRPSLISADLRGLLEPHPPVQAAEGGWQCRQWSAQVDAGAVLVRRLPGAGDRDDPLDAVRAACLASWQASDAGIAVHSVEGLPVEGLPVNGLSATP
jgi:glycerol 3-phosphatase-2